MNTRHEIPEELMKEFTPFEKKIAEILTTYTKDRTQEPHPLYYQAVCAAAKQIFVRIEEELINTSFGDAETIGEVSAFSLDIHDSYTEQFAVASRIEAKMLAPSLAFCLADMDPFFGEKIAIKYGFFDEDPDERRAVEDLLAEAGWGSEDTHPADTAGYAGYICGVLDARANDMLSWNADEAESFFDELLGMRPGWAEEPRWHLAALDLYEWFCLKNNLTFHQFPELFETDEFPGENLNYRLAALGLRYPSDANRFPQVVSTLNRYAEEHPDFRELRNFEDDPFADAYILEPVGGIAMLPFEYRGRETDSFCHRELMSGIESTVSSSCSGPFVRDTRNAEHMHRMYAEVCRCLEFAPVLEFSDEETVEDPTPEERKELDEFEKRELAWTVKTTLEPFVDCLEQDTDFMELCEDLAGIAEDCDVSRNGGRWELFDRLQVGLSSAFEKKLAKNLAYAVFVRLVARRHEHDGREEFRLRLAVARTFAEDRGTFGRPARSDGKTEPLAARLRQEFTSHPLVANQLAAKLHLLTYAVSQVDGFDPISHHYFLASTMKDLLDGARDAAGMPLTGRRTERWPWWPGQVYADDTGLLDFLYRNLCGQFTVQPCVDIRRVM